MLEAGAGAGAGVAFGVASVVVTVVVTPASALVIVVVRVGIVTPMSIKKVARHTLMDVVLPPEV